MEPADVHTLTGAYAADALDDLERAAFERHLEACPDCSEEVRGLRETVARLADGVAVPPPQRVRDRVLAQAALTPQVRTSWPTSWPTSAPTSGPTSAPAGRVAARAKGRTAARRGPWIAAAAALTAVSTGTGSLAWTQYRSAEEARTFARQVTSVVADPQARRVTATVDGGGEVTLVLADRRAVVVTAAMPELPEGRMYQLWIVRPQAVLPAGLGPEADEAAGSWARLVDGVRPGDTVAVSVEPLGGSAQPTTTPVVTLRA